MNRIGSLVAGLGVAIFLWNIPAIGKGTSDVRITSEIKIISAFVEEYMDKVAEFYAHYTFEINDANFAKSYPALTSKALKRSDLPKSSKHKLDKIADAYFPRHDDEARVSMTEPSVFAIQYFGKTIGYVANVAYSSAFSDGSVDDEYGISLYMGKANSYIRVEEWDY